MSDKSFSIADLGASAVGEIANGFINQGFTNYNRNRDYQNQKKLMDKSFAQAQQAQINSYSNMKAGMQKAGLSAAMLGSANPNAVVGSTPSAGTSQAPKLENQFNVQNLINIKAQNELLKAQKDNLEADTDNKLSAAGLADAQQGNLQYGMSKEQDADKTNVFTFMQANPDLWQKIVDTYFGGDELRAIKESTKGIFAGLESGMTAQANAQKALQDIEVVSRQNNNDRVLNALAQMPVAQKSVLSAQAAQAHSLAAKLHEETQLLATYGAETSRQTIFETKFRIDNLKKDLAVKEQNIKESIERADYWDSASKQAISQTVRNYVNSVTDIVDVASSFIPTSALGKAASNAGKSASKPAAKPKKPIIGKRKDGTNYIKGWSTPD